MTARSILIVGGFVALILLTLFGYRGKVTYAGHELSIPANCKSTTESNIHCSDYRLHWHYTDKSAQVALVKHFTSRILFENNDLSTDTVVLRNYNSALTTILFIQHAKVSKSISYGMVQGKHVVVVFEPARAMQQEMLFPQFVKDILSLS